MEKSFAEEFTVRGVDQRMGSKNLVQIGKRFARGKEKTASSEFQLLFLKVGLKAADCAVSMSSCFFLHPRDEFAAFIWRHLFCSVNGLPEFIRETFNDM